MGRIQILTKEQVIQLNELSGKFAERLSLAHPNMALEWEAQEAAHEQDYSITFHSPWLQGILTPEGYHLAGKGYTTLNHFCDIQIFASEGKYQGFERMKVGFGHPDLKKDLTAILGEPRRGVWGPSSRFSETPSELIPASFYHRVSIPMDTLSAFFEWSILDNVFKVYEGYAQNRQPMTRSG